MDGLEKEIRKWCRKITSKDMKNISNEMQLINLNSLSINEISLIKLNNGLIKLLCIICLQSNYTKDELKNYILDIVTVVLDKITKITDEKNYFSSLYHIIKIFFEADLPLEAIKISNCFNSNSLWHKTIDNKIVNFSQLASLWDLEIKKQLACIKTLDESNYNLLITLITLEMNADYSSKQYKFFLSKLSFYYDQIKSFKQQEYINRYSNLIKALLKNKKINFENNDKSEIFKKVFIIIKRLIISQINEKNVSKIYDEFTSLYDIFKKLLVEDEECLKLLKLYGNLFTICIHLIDQSKSDISDDIKLYKNKMNKMVKDYGYSNSIKHYSYAMLEFIDTILPIWIELNKKNTLSTKFIINIGETMIQLSNIFNNFNNIICESNGENCQLKTDTYSSVISIYKIVHLIQKIKPEMTSELRKFMFNTVNNVIKLIKEMKNFNCLKWTKHWLNVLGYIWNIGNAYEKICYKGSVELFTLACMAMFELDATEMPTFINQQPLHLLLHRLTSIYYSNGMYDKSMEICALNAYFNYKSSKCKAFRMWANIKYKFPNSNNVTILDYLKSHRKIYDKLNVKININNIDIGELCLCEIIALQEAEINLTSSIILNLNLMENFKVDSIIYAKGVLNLCYHLINFNSNESILNFINKGLNKISKKKFPGVKLIKGHLMFYKFIERLKEINTTTLSEMENATMKLTIIEKKPNSRDNDVSANVVPAYSLINLMTSVCCASDIDQILDLWMENTDKENISSLGRFFEPSLTLNTLIIAAEYIKFFKYDQLEMKAWRLAFKVAESTANHSKLIYIVSRSFSSKNFDLEWIKSANKAADLLKVSSNTNHQNNQNNNNNDDDDDDDGNGNGNGNDNKYIKLIAMYKLSLSKYYFLNNQEDKGRKLYDEISIHSKKNWFDSVIHLLSANILINHFEIDKKGCDFTTYIRNIVSSLYALITLANNLDKKRINRIKLLCELDILFHFTYKITIRLNNMISFREITAHLMCRLTIAQKLGSVIHVAECLKNLCYLDLSRGQLDNCQVKLDGLEHILQFQAYKKSRQATQEPTIDNNNHLDLFDFEEILKDIPQNDASPILRKKIFTVPEFQIHPSECDCFKCSNSSYKYLIFSCIHIRAQTYYLQKNTKNACEHFLGAFKLIKQLLNYSDKSFNIFEYVHFLLDLANFFRSNNFSQFEVIKIAYFAIEICKKHKIINHPVYISAKEIILHMRYSNHMDDMTLSSIMVPKINRLKPAEQNDNVCITPLKTTNFVSLNQKLKRRKTPPLLDFSQVNIDRIDNVEMKYLEPIKCDSPVPKKNPIQVKPIRRNLLKSQDLDSSDNLQSQPSTSSESLSVSHVEEISTTKKSSQGRVNIKKNGKKKVNKIDKHTAVDEVVNSFQEMKVETNKTDDVIEDNKNRILLNNTKRVTRASARKVYNNNEIASELDNDPNNSEHMRSKRTLRL